MRYLFMLCILAVLASGCTRVRNSLLSAGEDSLDMIHVDLMANVGTDVGAHVMVTKLVQVNAYSTENLYGFTIRPRQAGIFKEDRDALFLGPTLMGDGTMHFEGSKPYVIVSPYSLQKMEPHTILAESKDEIGAGIQFFIIGARVGVRPLELLDLVGNLVLLDFMADNPSWRERQLYSKMREAAKAAAAEEPTQSTEEEP